MTQKEIKYHNRLWYYKTYNQLIDKCLQMEKEGYPEDMYTEVHHILPRCQGGTNEKCNLVRMPVRYHIVAHMLLACAFPDEKGLVLAVTTMFIYREDNKQIERKEKISKISTRLISKFREDAARSQRNKIVSLETREKLSNINKGKRLSVETRKKISNASKGEKNGHYGKSHSLNTRRKMSEIWEIRKKKNIKKDDVNNKVENNPTVNSKKIVGPDGTIYNSMKIASKFAGIDRSTLRRWIKEFPERGYKYLEN